MKQKTALVIIYNHRYDKNINILEKIYKNRFSYIYHLVPFYDGEKSNVIPVYQNSFYFEGYIAQSLASFYNKEFSNYFFIADDLMMNPVINENNYTEIFNLSSNSSFLPYFINLHEKKTYWPHVVRGFRYKIKQKGIEAENELPSLNAAKEKFAKFNLEISPVGFEQIFGKMVFPGNKVNLISFLRFIYYKLYYFNKNEFEFSYPLIGGYADIFIITADTIKKFSHYCGVFAATNLFAEIAIPTAVVLSAEKIITENSLKLKGKPIWALEDQEILIPYKKNLKALLSDFPNDILYIHPVKLSRWDSSAL